MNQSVAAKTSTMVCLWSVMAQIKKLGRTTGWLKILGVQLGVKRDT